MPETQPAVRPQMCRALVAGAFVGAVLTAISFAIISLLTDQLSLASLGTLLWATVLAFLVALFFWAFGLTFAGAACWTALDRKGVRHWAAAVLLGFTLSALAAVLLFLVLGQRTFPLFTLGIGLIGSIVGLVVWRMAYGPSKPA